MATVTDALGSRFGDEVEHAHEILSDPELSRLLSRQTCREYGPAPVSSGLVDANDQRRAARHATSREKQRNAEIFGYADFYGWSEDKARPGADARHDAIEVDQSSRAAASFTLTCGWYCLRR